VGHTQGIAPARPTGEETVLDPSLVGSLREDCARAAEIVQARFPVRIDARADSQGRWYILDVNLKPNLGGLSRPRSTATLTSIAVQAMGWPYETFIRAVYRTAWQEA
jgi:D-alanine-D-alanine ligase-like ATP-grasp enzyme